MASVKKLLLVIAQIIGVAIIWTLCLSMFASLIIVGLHEGFMWWVFPGRF